MARPRPSDRLDRLVLAAAKVFTQRGYRRTQMADVARELGVAPGTLYLYVESKEALFDLVVQRTFLTEEAKAAPALPIPTPPPGRTLETLRRRARREAHPRLDAALRRTKVADAAEELRGIVRELYDTLSHFRRGVQLMERSALDWPELASVWVGDIRRDMIEKLTLYLERRTRQKHLRAMPNADAAARLVLETVAWPAVHRHGDAIPPRVTEEQMEETTVEFIVAALILRNGGTQ